MTLHFSQPLVLTSRGRIGTLVQDSPLEVANALGLLLDTRPGERRCVPGFGLTNPLGSGIDVLEVAAVIEEWEPRADPAEYDLEHIVEQTLTVKPADPTDTEA